MTTIAAVVFCKLNEKEHKLEISNESIYFYLNPNHIAMGSHALIHNGREFGVVQIVRNLTSKDPLPATNVTKPLLTEIYLSELDLKKAHKEIDALQAKAQRTRIDNSLEKLLGKAPLADDISHLTPPAPYSKGEEAI